MNNEWAVAELDKFIRLTESINGSSGGFVTPTSRSIHPRHEVLEQWAVVSKILEQTFPDWESECETHTHYEFGQRRDAAIHAKQLILRALEFQENLDPVGPVLSTKELHEWIWQPAQVLWAGGHYREAVQAAATMLDLELQIILDRRDITGRDLINQAFSANPAKQDSPRFVLEDQGNDQSNRSYGEGLKALGEACSALGRNLTSHLLRPLGEHEALELLAMMSYFAREVQKAGIARN